MSKYHNAGKWSMDEKILRFMFKNVLTHCTTVITSLLVRDKPLWAPASVKRVYCKERATGNEFRVYTRYQARYVQMSELIEAERRICVGNLTIIGSDNGLSPRRRQAFIWTNTRILLTAPIGANFSEILIEILTFPFKKMRLKVSSAKWRPFCCGLKTKQS